MRQSRRYIEPRRSCAHALAARCGWQTRIRGRLSSIELLVRSVRPGMLAEGPAACRDILSQPALRPFVLAERLPGGGVKGEEDLMICLPVLFLQDGSPSCRHLRGWASGENAVTTLDLKVRAWTACVSSTRSVMPFVPSCKYQRTDYHDRGEGVRCHPRSQIAAGGGFLTAKELIASRPTKEEECYPSAASGLSGRAGEPSIDRPSSTASLRVATNPLVSLHLLASDKATAASARELTEAALEHIITPRFRDEVWELLNERSERQQHVHHLWP